MDPQGDIWPHLAGEGEKSVTVDVEIYENWLVPAPEDHVNAPPAPIATGAAHDGHGHDEAHEDHSHLSRPELEQKAVSDEAAPCIGEQVMRPNKGQSLFNIGYSGKSKVFRHLEYYIVEIRELCRGQNT